MTTALVKYRKPMTFPQLVALWMAHASKRRKAPARTCRQGHRWTDANTMMTMIRGVRHRRCRACHLIAAGRRAWRQAQRQKLIAAHPDRGGTARQFIAARRAYLSAQGAA